MRPWVLEWPRCLVLPANHRVACLRVLHVSKCPNVNPQGWPGLWPDAQHSLLSPSKPLGGCQVLAGAGVAGVGWGEKRKGRKTLCGGSWWGCPSQGFCTCKWLEGQGA